MLKRLRLLIACFFSGHDYSVVSWTKHGMVTRCACCDRVRYLDIPRRAPAEDLDA